MIQKILGMKILVVEDEEKIARQIKKGLEENNFEVELAYDGTFGKRLALENKFDLIILDIIIPGINGLDLCHEIRKNKINTPIIMLTALGTTDDKVSGLDMGADDYLVKPFHFKELLARIKALTRRNKEIINSETLAIVDLMMDLQTKLVTRNGKEIKLTAREYNLLELFMRNQGKVLERKDIAAKVWDVSFDTGTNVIDVYVNYLRNKIDKDFKIKLIHTQVGMGYIMREQE